MFISFTAGQTEVSLVKQLDKQDATLSDVLAFWTGASTTPPLGFSKELEINYVHGDPGRLPESHTCWLILELTRGDSDPISFASRKKNTLTWSGGFTWSEMNFQV